MVGGTWMLGLNVAGTGLEFGIKCCWNVAGIWGLNGAGKWPKTVLERGWNLGLNSARTWLEFGREWCKNMAQTVLERGLKRCWKMGRTMLEHASSLNAKAVDDLANPNANLILDYSSYSSPNNV
ncbi:hypothetical protein L6452_19986 [Arctium lappa]|uniref:Uncharacterized protein n=1 Tax=Arctium lappa TaxID=4217 RepID=A0ACB9BBF5_ARCLA|nr:hypothetical protein L6452_19986 [Arctium lappa]